jgi:hypothetical protein
MIETTGSAGAERRSLGESAPPSTGVFSQGLDSIFGPGSHAALVAETPAQVAETPTSQATTPAQEVAKPTREVKPTSQETQPEKALDGKPAQAAPIELDTSESKNVGPDGKPLAARKLEDIKNIKIREGHKEGDPEANFVIDKDGKIKQKRPIDLVTPGGGGAADVIVEVVDDSAGAAARSANAAQKASLRSLISAIESRAANAGRDPEIPPQLLAALDAPANIPAPRVVRRGGGGSAAGGYGGGGGNMGGNGSFFNPGTPPASFYSDNAILPTSAGGGVIPPTGGDHGAGGGGVTPQPSFDFSQMGGIDMNNPIDKVVAMVSANEGKPNSINWNDNGHGISVGLFQANQKSGELPMLLNKMHDANPQLFSQVFGRQANNMLNENFVRSAQISQGNELGKMMQDAVNRPEFQKVQLDMMREKVAHASQVAGNYGIKSELGVALTADLINQLGEGGAKKHLQAAGNHGQEDQKLRAVVASSESNQWRNGRFERIANSGVVGMDQFRMA